MNCKKCNKQFNPEKGLKNYCSLTCRNSRSRDKKIKEAISKKLVDYYRINPRDISKMKQINSNPEKIKKQKQTWKSKININNAHYTTIFKYIKEEVGQCEICKTSEWQGKKLSLEVHHLNGDNRDNRIENIQVLCPNCHSQTHNWRGRKVKK